MADTEPDNQTEAASERRIENARREGQIPLGRDLTLVVSLVASLGVLAHSGAALCASLVSLVATSAATLAGGRPDQLLPLLVRPGLHVGAAVLAGAAAAIAAGIVQTHGGMWPELVLPDLSRVFNPQRLSRLFKREMLADLGMALVKNVALGWVLWTCIRDQFVTLGPLMNADAGAQLAALFRPFLTGAVKIVTVLAVIAGADLALTRLRFNKRMKMSKEELKREYRDDEGDPLIRARRRRKHRELVKGRVRTEVPRADVLVVNPTHIAIALRYRTGEDRAPRVTAKGKGVMAEAMRDLAREHGIPIVEDIALARLLWKRVRVGRFVPADTYKAVAAVLAFVYRVVGRRGAEDAR